MASHNDLGKTGEQMAVDWLTKNGYKILQRNWQCGNCEIDVIATKGKFLHFIEVKARNHNPHCHPESSVGKKKFKNMQFAADFYLLRNPGHDWIQYDILAITLHSNKEAEYFLLEDVYL